MPSAQRTRDEFAFEIRRKGARKWEHARSAGSDLEGALRLLERERGRASAGFDLRLVRRAVTTITTDWETVTEPAITPDPSHA